MLKPRIPPLTSDGAEPELNIFATLRHNEGLAKAFMRFGAYLLSTGLLPAREREIVILRTGWRCGSEYEFGQHTVIGTAAGLTEDEVRRLADAGPGTWDGADQALVTMVDELTAEDEVSDETWHALGERWSDAEIMELLQLAGYYRLVSGFLNSVGVALEAHTPGWPEGARPRRHASRDAAR